MVIPVLQFGGLFEPDACFFVTAEHSDNSMRLSLAYRNPACACVLPPCLTFEARSAPYLLRRRDGRCSNSREHLGTASPRRLTRIKCPPCCAGHTTRPPTLQHRSPPTVRGTRRPSMRRQSISTATSRTTQRPSKDPRADTKRIQTITYRPSYCDNRPQPTKTKRAARHPGLVSRQPSPPAQLQLDPRGRPMPSTSPCSSKATKEQSKRFATSTTYAQSEKR